MAHISWACSWCAVPVPSSSLSLSAAATIFILLCCQSVVVPIPIPIAVPVSVVPVIAVPSLLPSPHCPHPSCTLFLHRKQWLAAAVGALSQWWSPSSQGCCYGGGVCCPACPSSFVIVVIILWWSCCHPLCSSPFHPTSVAHGHGGWCCVAWVLHRHGHSCVPLLVVVAGLIVPVVSWSGWQ
jgi:hypothetical protein